MSNWPETFRARVKMLLDVLPVVAGERRFALKGGTAINLFEHDLPRLSVDIDLTWLPVADFTADGQAITEALRALSAALSAPPLRLQVQTSAPETAGITTRLIATRPGARIQIETTPVMRGTVHPVRTMAVQPRVEEEFGFAEMQVLDFADLYGGKLAATLSRQHPRDLFDVLLLLESGRLDRQLWRTFLVYLTASQKPAWELLEPGEPRDLATSFRTQFEGMTAESVSVTTLVNARSELLSRIPQLMDDAEFAFLESVEREAPDFNLIGLPQAADLPGIRRKLQNLAQRSAMKREADHHALSETLARLGRRRNT